MSGGLRYGSVCSGIEAATVAWHPLGWEPAFFSEIEAFPRAVLQHRYPHVPLHGDFTTIGADDYGPIDLLVGGTPCQSFSVAGLRGGLDDERGNLALEYLRLADRKRPRWLAWENVPGVFSSISHAAPDPCPPPPPLDLGRDGEEMETEDEYNSEEVHAFYCFLAGISELGYGFAWRVLDAQYVRVDGHSRAVPQRRRRVFLVGYLGDWRPAAAVLSERESLRRDPPPRREAGQGTAPTLAARTRGGGGLGTDFDCDGGLIASTGDVAHCLETTCNDYSRADGFNMIAHALRGDGFDASEDGPRRGTPLVPVAFTAKDYGGDAMTECSPTLRAGGHTGSHANAGVMPAVAFDLRGREGGAMPEGPHDTANIRAASGGSSRSYLATAYAVRRLTPRECERLQGFPDDYTAIPYRGKPADLCPDGPRYKALGNSMAVNVMRWIGQRIQMVEDIVAAQRRAAE